MFVICVALLLRFALFSFAHVRCVLLSIVIDHELRLCPLLFFFNFGAVASESERSVHIDRE